jgi:hypothetical protein
MLTHKDRACGACVTLLIGYDFTFGNLNDSWAFLLDRLKASVTKTKDALYTGGR